MNNIFDDTTFILGFWYHEKNVKRDLEHYLKYIPQTLALLKDCKIVFYYEQDFVLDFVKQHIQTQEFKAIKIYVKDLPTYNLSENFLKSCINQDNIKLLNHKKIKPLSSYEKGLVHYNREYLKSGQECYRHIITVWTSKLFLMNNINYDTKYIAWIDVAFAHTKICLRQILTPYNITFTDDLESLHGFRYVVTADKLGMRYYSELLQLLAGFMLCSKKFLQQTFLPLYEQQLHLCKDSNYAHDEETILHLISKKHPKLFKSIKI